MFKEIPCVEHPSICPDCHREVIKDVYGAIQGMNNLKKVIDKLPHEKSCPMAQCTCICNCLRSKIEEIFNG